MRSVTTYRLDCHYSLIPLNVELFFLPPVWIQYGFEDTATDVKLIHCVFISLVLGVSRSLSSMLGLSSRNEYLHTLKQTGGLNFVIWKLKLLYVSNRCSFIGDVNKKHYSLWHLNAYAYSLQYNFCIERITFRKNLFLQRLSILIIFYHYPPLGFLKSMLSYGAQYKLSLFI